MFDAKTVKDYVPKSIARESDQKVAVYYVISLVAL